MRIHIDGHLLDGCSSPLIAAFRLNQSSHERNLEILRKRTSEQPER